MSRPTIKRSPVELPTLAGQNAELWPTLIDLTNIDEEWTLIGGQMVYLHALEHDVTPTRVSTDLDVLVNVRVATKGLRKFVKALQDAEFELAGSSPEGIAHRYLRRGVSIDVLAPEGLGDRADLTTTPPGRTIMVPGGKQALDRTELVPVVCGRDRGFVPRPSLLGALVGKALAVDVDDTPNAQREDLALLLTLVEAPLNLKRQLTPKDRKRLRLRHELGNAEHPAWKDLAPKNAANGVAAYLLLTA